MHLGRRAELKDAHLISGLIDGLPTDMEMALAGFTRLLQLRGCRLRYGLSPPCSDLKHSAYQVKKRR
ncbi:hypothetical protein HPB50_010421 [Hyalomma asiaticum]|uniref:Uncharacterized protein n=1 Tax=Hyalomma asiaticum TaxID=266040 RepID=A0ACB7SFM1_HYAAI|nr:hypothetical protein HPB50_010421 [Hyalomma asiaticum]